MIGTYEEHLAEYKKEHKTNYGKGRKTMSGLNKTMLIGRLGADPELRHTQSGDAVCNFTMATSEKWKGKDGEMQEKTEWHRIVAWKKVAEICDKYLSKGKQVYIEGRLQTRKWEDKDGNKRYTTEIVANQVVFLGNKNDSDQGGGSGRERNQDDYNGPVDDEYPF